MRMYRVLIIEDEILIAENLKDFLLDNDFSKIKMAHNKSEALVLMQTFAPHFVLLDIRMENEKTGLEIAQLIQQHYQIPFIFITAHSDLKTIQEIVSLNPIAYVNKPFKKPELFAAISMVVKILSEKQTDFIQIKNKNTTKIIKASDILYIESDDNYITLHLTNEQKVTVRQTINSLLEENNVPHFIRIHRSYIINTDYLLAYSRKGAVLRTITLPVSRSSFPELELFMQTKTEF